MSESTITTIDGTFPVPELWRRHHWSRPLAFLSSVNGERIAAATHPYLFDKIVSGFTLRPMLNRRSLTAIADVTLTLRTLQELLRAVYRANAYSPQIFAGILTADIVGWKDGLWLVDNGPRSLRPAPTSFDPDVMGRIIQGQVWGAGRGFAVLLGIDWAAASELYDDANTAYADALLTVGRMGHSILLDAQSLGLAARMTPAVHESTAADALGLPTDRDVLYVLRLAPPRE